MYKQCREYLVGKLRAAGIRRPPFTSMKKLALSKDSHVGAVLFGDEVYLRSGSKRIYRNERGVKQKRRKIFDRTLSFEVIIGEYDADKVEEILEAFLAGLDRGIYIGGNFVGIEVERAEWVEKDDSILVSQLAMQLKVNFEGGVYRDTGYADMSKADVRFLVEKHSKKEDFDNGEESGGGAGDDPGGDGPGGTGDDGGEG